MLKRVILNFILLIFTLFYLTITFDFIAWNNGFIYISIERYESLNGFFFSIDINTYIPIYFLFFFFWQSNVHIQYDHNYRLNKSNGENTVYVWEFYLLDRCERSLHVENIVTLPKNDKKKFCIRPGIGKYKYVSWNSAKILFKAKQLERSRRWRKVKIFLSSSCNQKSILSAFPKYFVTINCDCNTFWWFANTSSP